MRARGTSITAIRERSGISKTELAKATGIDRTHLHRIETGERNGTDKQLVAIAHALGVPITAVVDNDTAEVA